MLVYATFRLYNLLEASALSGRVELTCESFASYNYILFCVLFLQYFC